MQIKMKCKRALAFVLALLMLMTMLPTAAFAEELPSDVATSTDVTADPIASQENEPVSEEPTDPDEEAEQPAAEDGTAADDPAVSEEDAPAIESEDIDSSEIPYDTPEESADCIVAEETTDAADTELPASLTLQETIEANGFAYVRAVRPTKVYNTPELCNAYCARECPIGKGNVREVTIDDFDRLALKALGSLKDIDSLRASLIAISEDGVIDAGELDTFNEILEALEKISTNAKALQLWAMKNIRVASDTE